MTKVTDTNIVSSFDKAEVISPPELTVLLWSAGGLDTTPREEKEGGTRPVAMETRTDSWGRGLRELRKMWFVQRWWVISVQVQPALRVGGEQECFWQILEVQFVVGTTWRQSVIFEKKNLLPIIYTPTLRQRRKLIARTFFRALWNMQMMLHLMIADRKTSFVPTFLIMFVNIWRFPERNMIRVLMSAALAPYRRCTEASLCAPALMCQMENRTRPDILREKPGPIRAL